MSDGAMLIRFKHDRDYEALEGQSGGGRPPNMCLSSFCDFDHNKEHNYSVQMRALPRLFRPARLSQSINKQNYSRPHRTFRYATSTAGAMAVIFTAEVSDELQSARPEGALDRHHHNKNGSGFNNPWESCKEIPVLQLIWALTRSNSQSTDTPFSCVQIS